MINSQNERPKLDFVLPEAQPPGFQAGGPQMEASAEIAGPGGELRLGPKSDGQKPSKEVRSEGSCPELKPHGRVWRVLKWFFQLILSETPGDSSGVWFFYPILASRTGGSIPRCPRGCRAASSLPQQSEIKVVCAMARRRRGHGRKGLRGSFWGSGGVLGLDPGADYLRIFSLCKSNELYA